jgi:hypothetical protein
MADVAENDFEMDQAELTARFCARPQNFAWFLGAGASATAGVPTATDILWDMKLGYYCREENRKITHQDMQNDTVRAKIQGYMESKGFPALWADDEYTTCFEKIFGDDRERQRQYMHGVLAEDRARLSVGNRVLGGFLGAGFCRAVFTTNFDSIVEKAVAEVSGKSLAAFHLEGSHAANQALNNEEFPIYCKLHGDFRYDSLKNLSADLATQNAELAKCLVNAGNRFGFVITGYSGRDKSIMDLFHSVLETANPFPHGLFWTGLKGSTPLEPVAQLLVKARANGVAAHFVPIETFDALLLRLWRNTPGKPEQMDALVCKSKSTSVHIPLPQPGRGEPLVRLNALPVLSAPSKCFELSFRQPKNWDDIKRARASTGGRLILTQGTSFLCWGGREDIKTAFGSDLVSITERDVPTDLASPGNLHVKGFIEEALCKALARGKPLRPRIRRHSVYLAANARHKRQADLQPLVSLVGSIAGAVPSIMAPVDEKHPVAEQVTWAEAARISADFKDGHLWLLIEPDIWIEPARARKLTVDFLDKRREDRYNKKFNDLLDAWVHIILGTTQLNTPVTLLVFDSGTGTENPAFGISSRTAYTRRHTG